MASRDPQLAVRHMREHALEAIELLADRGQAELHQDRLLTLALTRLVEIVGEAAQRVPRDFQAHHPGPPWADVIGMRRRLIHGYDDVDLAILYATVRTDFPRLIEALDEVLSELGDI